MRPPRHFFDLHLALVNKMLLDTDLSVITYVNARWQSRRTSVSIRTATWTFADNRNLSPRSCVTANTKTSFRKFSSSWHIQYNCEFIIYSDSYYIKQLNVGRSTYGMIVRDGSF